MLCNQEAASSLSQLFIPLLAITDCATVWFHLFVLEFLLGWLQVSSASSSISLAQ